MAKRAKKKRGRGRPRKGSDVRRAWISVRTEASTKIEARQAAAASGYSSLSEWIEALMKAEFARIRRRARRARKKAAASSSTKG